jgi:hypothetical protein
MYTLAMVSTAIWAFGSCGVFSASRLETFPDAFYPIQLKSDSTNQICKVKKLPPSTSIHCHLI